MEVGIILKIGFDLQLAGTYILRTSILSEDVRTLPNCANVMNQNLKQGPIIGLNLLSVRLMQLQK